MSGSPVDDTLSDAVLVSRAAAGDEPAFSALVTRHQASVFRLARALTRSHDVAEDILQQTFLAAWQALPRFRGESSVRTWLLTIARNAVWHQRSNVVREAIDEAPIDELAIRAGWGEPGPEALAIQAETRAFVATALARLQPEDRAILILRELEGLSGDDTATLLNLTLPAMKSRLHRARLRLAAELRLTTTQGDRHAARRT